MAGKLVNRTKLGDAVNNELYAKLNIIAAHTEIPRSKLLDKAIELLVDKYKDSIEELNK